MSRLRGLSLKTATFIGTLPQADFQGALTLTA
jgi:hypothetical protein